MFVTEWGSQMVNAKRIIVSNMTIEEIEPIIEFGFHLQVMNGNVVAVLEHEKKLVKIADGLTA